MSKLGWWFKVTPPCLAYYERVQHHKSFFCNWHDLRKLSCTQESGERMPLAQSQRIRTKFPPYVRSSKHFCMDKKSRVSKEERKKEGGLLVFLAFWHLSSPRERATFHEKERKHHFLFHVETLRLSKLSCKFAFLPWSHCLWKRERGRVVWEREREREREREPRRMFVHFSELAKTLSSRWKLREH